MQQQNENKNTIELDDETFFNPSQRNSERFDIEIKRLSAGDSGYGFRTSNKSGHFPDNEFFNFKKVNPSRKMFI